jgi:hypothetical protein
MTTNGSPNLRGKNLGRLESVQDSFRETCSNKEILLSSTAVKLENFITSKGFNHRQFISLLQDLDAEHADVP